MSKASRDKGAAGEREAIQIIRVCGWPHAQRTSDGRTQAARGDVAHGPEGVAIEIKRQERLNVPNALTQVVADAELGQIPVLVHRPSRQEWMATLPLDELLSLLKFRESA